MHATEVVKGGRVTGYPLCYLHNNEKESATRVVIESCPANDAMYIKVQEDTQKIRPQS